MDEIIYLLFVSLNIFFHQGFLLTYTTVDVDQHLQKQYYKIKLKNDSSFIECSYGRDLWRWHLR